MHYTLRNVILQNAELNDCDFLNPISIYDIKPKNKPVKTMGISNQKPSPKVFKLLIQFKSISKPNALSLKKKIWVRTLSFLDLPKRLTLLRDFKRQLMTMATTDNSLREYAKSSLKNLEEFSKYHKYDIGTFDPTAQEDLAKKGSPFKDMTDQISDNFLRKIAKKPLRPSSEGFKSLDKGSNFLEVSAIKDVEEFILQRQNFGLNLSGQKGNYMKSRIPTEMSHNGGVDV
jgi:hypothetical protein